jgi:para-aminobenzoate synthetase / 4-amino-4-deoxychorismate lyase
MPPDLILRDARRQEWLQFSDPLDVISVRQVDEVPLALEKVAQVVEQDRHWAAGFLSYEAGPAFDPALQAHPPDDFPPLWFGIFRSPEVLASLPQARIGPGFRLADWSISVTRESYRDAIAHIKDLIARGDTYQVNFTLRMRASFQGDPFGLFQHLMRVQPTDYAAYVDLGRFAVCSASPELFFQLDGDRILAKPMKGTIARGLTPQDDRQNAVELQASTKDRAENVMILDMLRNDLGRIAETGSVEVPDIFAIERHPSLWQMTSTVTAKTQASIVNIFSALFPCASITGAPKPGTTGIIAELESTSRRIYTGAIGFLAPGRKAQFNVAIRTVLIDRSIGVAEYGTGGGIVWDSTAEGEYQECLLKARLLTEERPVFSLLESLLWRPAGGYTLLDYHFRRLASSADYFDYPIDLVSIRTELDTLAAGLAPADHKVRLLLDRTGAITCEAVPISAIPKPSVARVRLAPAPVDLGDVFLYHKTTHRRVYQAAEMACPDCDEVLLWNEHGEVTETTSANLVMDLDGELVTPPVASGLLAGTYRAWLLDRGRVREKVVRVEDLQRCARIEIVNSVRPPRQALLV